MNRGERKGNRGEGWLIAAALGFVLALSLAVCAARTPPKEEILPVHAVPFEEMRRMEMVDINAASVEEIATLPGVGEVLAGRIAAYREENGPFESAEELLDVEGIGEAKLDAMRNEIYID